MRLPRDLPGTSAVRRALLGGALVTALLTLAACKGGDDKAKAAPPPPEVKVVAARLATIPYSRDFVGHVTAYRSVEVRARVEGIIDKRHFTEGTDVTRGQLLYTIESAPFEATLRDAQADLAGAQANLANARAREARYGPLARENAISKQDYDDALSQLRQAEAAVLSAKAKVDRATLNLGYTKVHATEAGRIGLTLVPEGRLVGKGEPTHLATIDKLDPIYVTFTVSDRDVLAFRSARGAGLVKGEQAGFRARIVLPDGSEYEHAGKIDFTDMQVNQQTGTITLRAVVPNASLPNGNKKLVPGMFVNIEFVAGERPNTLLVPQKAVVKVPTGHVAWVVTADNKAERRVLVVGEWSGGDWVITKGLAADEQVVVEGIQRLAPGAVVKPSPVAAAGTAPVPAR